MGYGLFRVVVGAPVSPAYPVEKKWEDSRLIMRSAYKRKESLPLVGDPRDVLTFLRHNFDLAVKGGENQDELIRDVSCTLVYAFDPAMFKTLKDFDPINPSFVRCLRYAYRNDKSLKLRKAALFFLPLIGDKIFNTPEPIIEHNEMESFCTDWASTVDSLKLTPDVQKAVLTVLLGMINSPHWRPHIVPEKWQLLKYFTSVPDNSQPFRRCIDNQDLIEVVGDMDNPAPSFLWLMILWLKYEELIPEVRTQLENVTRKVGKGRRRIDLDVYLAGMDSESHQAARSALSALKGG